MKSFLQPLLIFGVAVGVVVAVRAMTSAPAVDAPSFFQHTTLDAGLEQAELEGKPVFAFATADWCGPCQRFKGSTLSEPAVAEFLGNETVPVYIDVTERGNTDAAMLGVRSIPAAFIIEPGGNMYPMPGQPSGDGLISWVKTVTN
ncbi:MAG: thioredoxin family protein [Planctomycetota bacterium]